jgi:hypothetical protein
LFSTAIGSFLDIIADVINNYAIPRLIRLNDFKISDYPKLEHGDIENVDLTSLGDYISKLAQSGFPLFPNMELEKYLMKVANLPEPLDEAIEQDQQVTPKLPEEPERVYDIRDDGKQRPSGPNIPNNWPNSGPKPKPAFQAGDMTQRLPRGGGAGMRF